MNSTAWQHWFVHPSALILWALVPLLSVAVALAGRSRRRVLARLGRLPALAGLTDRRRQWRTLRAMCLLTALSFLAIGIAGPQWGREPEVATADGRDLVVLLDMSRSMLADDVPPDPSRLERAKKALSELVHYIEKRGGH